MSGHTSTVGQPGRLPDHVFSLQRGLQQARNHANDLRGENERLKERLERKDQRISELLEEKFGLADQLHAKTMEVVQLRSSHSQVQKAAESQGPGEEAEPQVKKTMRRPGNPFTIMLTSYQRGLKDDGGASKGNVNDPDRQKGAAAREPPDAKLKKLNRVPWVISRVPEEERTAWKKISEEAVIEDGQGGDGSAKSPTLAPNGADANRGVKRRRLDSQDAAFHDRRGSVALSRDKATDTEPRGRSPYLGRKGSNYKGRGPYHKAVCVHCWLTKELCDSAPQCKTCVSDGVRCVRKLCEDGLRCQCPKCPRLHPGQWDETDPEFVVEEGRMPRK